MYFFFFFCLYLLYGIPEQVQVHQSIRRCLLWHLEREQALASTPLFTILDIFLFWNYTWIIGFLNLYLTFWIIEHFYCNDTMLIFFLLLLWIYLNLLGIVLLYWNSTLFTTGFSLHHSVRPSVIFYTRVEVCHNKSSKSFNLISLLDLSIECLTC